MKQTKRIIQSRMVLVLLVVLGLTGCATFSEDGGFTEVSNTAKDALGQEPQWHKSTAAKTAAHKQVKELLASELSMDTVVKVALLNNPRLQAEYANLGIAESGLVQAGRLPNPGFSFSRTNGGGGQEIERGLHFNVMSVLTMPIRVGMETRLFNAAKLAAAVATVATGIEARRAWINAVHARQSLRYFEQVVESAQASRELMQRMRRVGNSSRLDLAREQLFHAEASASLLRARQRETKAYESLIRVLGAWGELLPLRLPERLPGLPAQVKKSTDVERKAIEGRLDIRRARHDLERMTSSLNLTQATRFVNVLEVGPAQVRERGEPIRDGYEISLEIPLFDWGGAKVTRAQAMASQAADRLRAVAIDARSQVREAYLGYHSSYELARHYQDEILPLRKRISDEQLLRYNGMLISVFELIEDSRQQVASVSASIDALREFWLAEMGLQTSMLMGPALGDGMSAAVMTGGAEPQGH